MHFLDILVPQYKETDEIIKPLLDSIALQQNVDFNTIGVIIVNDGTDIYLSDSFLANYPFQIEYYKEEHRGVSGTRNSCLDHSTAQYVMFCDADDMFFNACGLWMVFNELKKKPVDYYSSMFVEETRIEGGWGEQQPYYVNRENDSTFVHGKFMRRQFLLDNNLRWNENLTIHEDSYFNCLCHITAQRLTQSIQYCPTAFYLWKYRDDSVCRRDPLYLNKTYVNMYDSNDALVTECIKRDYKQDAINLVVSMVYESYCLFNTDKWLKGEGAQYLLQTEKRFKKYWLKFKEVFNLADTNKKIELMSEIRTKYFKKGLISEQITFDNWINYIEELED